MQSLDAFLPDVFTFVPNCPDLLAQRWLRQAAITFCEKTKLWRELDEIVITETEFTGVTAVPDAAILEINDARLDGVTLDPVTNEWLDGHRPGWQRETEAGQAKFITQVAPDTVSVVPRQAGTVEVRLILKPSRSADNLPDFMLEHYSVLVARGAAAELLKLPKTDFENPQLAVAHMTDFEAEVARLAVKARKTQIGAPLRTTMRY